MKIPSEAAERDACVIGERVLFEMREDRLRKIVSPEYELKLKREQVEVLLQLVRAPGIVLQRSKVLNQAIHDGLNLSGRTLDEVVRSLQEAFAQIDPDKTYIRILPRLGYVLVATVTSRET